jgi:membrane protein DedA with SNARE-associated domain
MHFVPAWLTAAAGSICGITLSYALGRTAGATIVTQYGSWLHISQARLRRVEQWMEHGGRWILTIGYYIPGVRHVTAIVAGSTRLPYRIFSGYAYLGAAVWSLSFIALGWAMGDEWESALATVHRHVAVIAIAFAVLAGGYAIVHARWISRPKA